MICPNCKKETNELFELSGTIGCEECWYKYWGSPGIGNEESFSDFIKYTATKVKYDENK